MNLFATVASFLVVSNCDAFAPSANGVSRTRALNAETLEGWKIDGKIKPVNNFVLVKKAEDASETDSGILLSNTAKIKKTEGVVVDVGPGKCHPDSGIPIEISLEKGESVIFGKFDGTEVKIDGETHSLIRDDDVLVKFTGGPLSEENVEMINDKVLVYVKTRELQTSGGLILGSSTSDQKRPSTGTVVKVGPGKIAASGELIPMNVEVGDEVKFMDFAGNEIKIGDNDYSVVQMPEILAKF